MLPYDGDPQENLMRKTKESFLQQKARASTDALDYENDIHADNRSTKLENSRFLGDEPLFIVLNGQI